MKKIISLKKKKKKSRVRIKVEVAVSLLGLQIQLFRNSGRIFAQIIDYVRVARRKPLLTD